MYAGIVVHVEYERILRELLRYRLACYICDTGLKLGYKYLKSFASLKVVVGAELCNGICFNLYFRIFSKTFNADAGVRQSFRYSFVYSHNIGVRTLDL